MIFTKGDVQNESKLTPKQKQLVADNHRLIYSYAKKNHLKLDEWYDVLAIAMCKAARRFDPDKGKFSTWCYRHFDNEVRTVRNDARKKSRIPNDLIVPYESMFKAVDCNDDNSDRLIDVGYAEDRIYDMLVYDIEQNMTRIERDVFDCLINGYTLRMIASEVGCTPKEVSKTISSIKTKVREYMNY